MGTLAIGKNVAQPTMSGHTPHGGSALSRSMPKQSNNVPAIRAMIPRAKSLTPNSASQTPSIRLPAENTAAPGKARA